MNITTLHSIEKPVSAKPLFKANEGSITAIKILEHHQLKEHISKTPALLVCIQGQVVFHNEKGLNTILSQGDYIIIDPFVKHRVDAITSSDLILCK